MTQRQRFGTGLEASIEAAQKLGKVSDSDALAHGTLRQTAKVLDELAGNPPVSAAPFAVLLKVFWQCARDAGLIPVRSEVTTVDPLDEILAGPPR